MSETAMPPAAAPASPNIHRNLGFLLAEISRLFRREFNRRAVDLELTQAQWRALAHLSHQEGVCQAALAERLEVQPITLARQLDRLEAAGWVERRRDPDDRRALRLHLTPQAGPLIARIRALAAEVREEALEGLDDAAREGLLDALCAIRANLQRVTREGCGDGGGGGGGAA